MEKEQLMAEIEMPPELDYTISYMKHIAKCCFGKIVISETRAQALFPVGELIQNLELAEFCYPLKSALIFYLHNVYFETEKEINEDFFSQISTILR
jgi:hypothetical protein